MMYALRSRRVRSTGVSSVGPQNALSGTYARALAHGADQTRSLGAHTGVSRPRLRIADEMSCHLDLSGGADDIQGDRFRTVETQYVQPLERNRVAQQKSHVRQRHIE